jgi:hypothetical protein
MVSGGLLLGKGPWGHGDGLCVRGQQAYRGRRPRCDRLSRLFFPCPHFFCIVQHGVRRWLGSVIVKRRSRHGRYVLRACARAADVCPDGVGVLTEANGWNPL